MLAATAVVGGLFGGAMGGVMGGSALEIERQALVLTVLIAALWTFGAGAVLATPPASPQGIRTLWRPAMLHIALAIIAALAGILLIRWWLG